MRHFPGTTIVNTHSLLGNIEKRFFGWLSLERLSFSDDRTIPQRRLPPIFLERSQLRLRGVSWNIILQYNYRELVSQDTMTMNPFSFKA